MADDKLLIEIIYDTKEAEKNLVSITNKITEFEEEQKSLREAVKKGVLTQEQYNQATAENREQITKLKKVQKDEIKLIQAEKNSRNALKVSISRLVKERDNLNLSTEKGQKDLKRLNAEIDRQNEILRETGSQLDKQRMNIGNYPKQLTAIVPGLQGISDGVSGLNEKFKAGTEAVKKLAGRFSMLLALPIIAIFAAIAAATIAIGKSIMQTEKAQLRWNRTTEASKAAWREFVSTFVDSQKGLIGLSERLKQARNESFNLFNLTQKLGKSYALLTKSIANLNRISEVQRSISDDTTKSFYEREQALEKATLASEEAARKEFLINKGRAIEAKRNLDLSESQGIATNELRQQYAELYAQAIQSETAFLTIQKQNERERNELRQDRLERDLDILIDGFDAVKTTNERIIADENRTLQERQKALDYIRDYGQKTYLEQIQIIEEFAGKKINADELMRISDSKVLNDRIRGLGLSEIIEGRALEIFRERLAVNRDYTDAQNTLNKSLEKEREKQEQILQYSEKRKQNQLIQTKIVNDATLQNIDQTESLATEIIQRESEKRRLIAEQEKQDRIDKQEKIRNAITQAAYAATQISAESFNLIRTIQQKNLQQELAAVGNNEKKREEIEKKFAKKRKRLAITEAIINGALAALNGFLTKPFIPAGLAAGALATTLAGIQIATISNAQFKKGGKVPVAKDGAKFGTFQGASHSGGGIDLFTGSGKHVANVEGNENFYVIKKEASDYINRLSNINENFGGRRLSEKSGRMAEGGQADLQQDNAITKSDLFNVLKNLNLSVKVEDIKTGLDQRQQVINTSVV